MNKISVIVPVYNVENYLNRCLDSIIGQTYKNLEIIIVDDGSTDKSTNICDLYVKIDNRVRVFHKKNGGLSDARNYGMKYASGDYYVFIDSDDVLHRDFCKVLIDNATLYNADIVSTGIINFYSDGELVTLNNETVKSVVVIEKDQVLNEYFMPTSSRIIQHGLCMKMYKKSLFNNKSFEVGRLHEDLFITHQLLNDCNKFVFVDAPYYFYFQRNMQSISNNYKTKNFLDEYDCVEEIYNKYKTNPMVCDSLICFCAYHYIYMLERIGGNNSNIVEEKKRKIKEWITRNIWSTNRIGFEKKIKLIFGTYFTRQYMALRRIKKIVKKVNVLL